MSPTAYISTQIFAQVKLCVPFYWPKKEKEETKILFLFFTSTFTKHPHQFIYSTHLFNKILILLPFLLFSHSWPFSLSLKPNHRHHHLATIKPKPRSLRPKLCDFFISHSHGWSELKPRSSRNLDPFKQKPKVDRSEGCWSGPFKPKSMPTKRTNREWMRKEEVD